MSSCHPQPKSRAQLAKLSPLVMIALCLVATPAASQFVNHFPPTNNVGIGTGTPTELLEISTVASLGHLMMKLNAATDRYAQQTYYENGVLKWNIYNDFVNDNLCYGNNTGPKMCI